MWECVCLCVPVEVIISSGLRDFLVPVVVLRGAVQDWVSQLVPFNSPPFCYPLSPPPLWFPLKLPSVILLFPLWRDSALISPLWDTRDKRGSKGKLWRCTQCNLQGETCWKEYAEGALLLSIRSGFVEEPLLKRSAADLFPPAGLSVICPCSKGRENQSRLEKVASSGFAVFGSW